MAPFALRLSGLRDFHVRFWVAGLGLSKAQETQVVRLYVDSSTYKRTISLNTRWSLLKACGRTESGQIDYVLPKCTGLT